MDPKPVSASAVTLSTRAFPKELNPAGNVHGGVLLTHVDLAAASAAMRHCRTRVVTRSLERMDFVAPAKVGQVIHFKASLNAVGRSSMEVGVRVEAEDLLSGDVYHVATGYLTIISMGADGRPQPVPPLGLETPDDHRRHAAAIARVEARKKRS